MRSSAEGFVVSKCFMLISSEFMFPQNTQESNLCLNSSLKCVLSKRIPLEEGEASRNRGQLGADACCHGHTG